MNAARPALRRAASWLRPHREAILKQWGEALAEAGPRSQGPSSAERERWLDAFLHHLSGGEVEELLAEEARAAAVSARRGASLLGSALAIRVLDRCLVPFLLREEADRETLAETLLALDELGDERLEVLLRAQEEESSRRVVEAQEQAARAEERAREVERANEALRRAESLSRHRAEQIALLATVARRIAPVREPEELMQQAADVIQARMNHGYVALVVLDDEGVLVGRWAGRRGVGRRSRGRAQGPPGGIIGRAIRMRSPQVVGDVSRDPDYHADVPGTRSEMAIPLLEGGVAVGALDVQSEEPSAFGLDDVAAAEALGEFLVVALRNARLYEEARRR